MSRFAKADMTEELARYAAGESVAEIALTSPYHATSIHRAVAAARRKEPEKYPAPYQALRGNYAENVKVRERTRRVPVPINWRGLKKDLADCVKDWTDVNISSVSREVMTEDILELVRLHAGIKES